MTDTVSPQGCKAITTTGDPCRAAPGPGGYCFVHDPALGEKRAAARRAGGRRQRVPHSDAPRPPAQVRTLADVLAVLDYGMAELLEHENSIQRVRVLATLASAFIEAIKIGELETRLAAIEAAMKAGNGD
jgi:hypothetical protein